MRLWRAVFDSSEIPSNAPAGLDDSRTRWSTFAFVAPFLLVLLLFVAGQVFDLGFETEVGALIATGLTIVLLGGGLIVSFWFTHGRADAHFLKIRESAREPAVAAGYEFFDSFPPPLPGTSEAVFFKKRYLLVPQRLTQVITGTVGGFRFTAGHLEGVEVSRNTRRPARLPYSENIVMVALPGLLPELKLRDRGASTPGDYGVSLPSVPTGDVGVDARWDVQSHHPELARLFFTREMLDYLITVPFVPCTMVIRNGYLISCRDPLGDFGSISQRLAILVGLVERIPAELWERGTTAAEAGSGRAIES
jgi:hypothetical protein